MSPAPFKLVRFTVPLSNMLRVTWALSSVAPAKVKVGQLGPTSKVSLKNSNGELPVVQSRVKVPAEARPQNTKEMARRVSSVFMRILRYFKWFCEFDSRGL